MRVGQQFGVSPCQESGAWREHIMQRQTRKAQHELEEGPSLAALRGQDKVLVPDLHVDGRWKRFASAVSGEGIRSVLAAPLAAGDAAMAVLGCYSFAPDTFDSSTIDAVQEHALSMSRILKIALRIPAPALAPRSGSRHCNPVLS